MWFLPVESFIIRSDSDRETVIKQIEENINPPIKFSLKNIFKRPDREKYFDGSYDGKRFSLIQALKQGQNSFRPIIKCKVNSDGKESKVSIVMYIHPVAILFLLWILILSTGSIIIFTSNQKFKPDSTGYIMFLVCYCLFTFLFKYEALKDKKELNNIINPISNYSPFQ